MKNNNIILLISLLICNLLVGQNKKISEQIQASKVAFITNEMNLTKTEAEKFWPIYNAFEDKQHELRRNKGKQLLNKSKTLTTNLSEKEAASLLQQIEKYEEEVYLSKKKFQSDLLNIIPASKILKLKKADNAFKKKLLKQYRQKRD